MNIDQGGSVQTPKAPTPRAIEAQGQSRDSFVRTLAGAIILGVLTIAYLIALFQEIEGASNILVLLSSGLGFLFGGKNKSDN